MSKTNRMWRTNHIVPQGAGIAVLAALICTLLPGAAASAGACSPVGRRLTVRTGDDSLTLARNKGKLVVDGAACARLADVDALEVVDAAGNDLALTLDLAGGGFVTRSGREVELSLKLGNGVDSLLLRGSAGRDVIETYGTSADLDAAIGRGPTLFTSGIDSWEHVLRGGHDALRTGSSSATSAPTGIVTTYPKARIFGGPGNDTISGDDNVNVIWAGGGDDTVYARGSDDEVQGGSGNDVLWGGWGDDLVNGGPGNDSEYGADNNDLFQQSPQLVHSSTEGPKTAVDKGDTYYDIVVPPAPMSTVDVNARIYIDHPETQDLWVTLIAPDTNRVRLLERRGNGTPLNGTQFDSEADTNIKFAGAKHLSGRFHPEWSMELVQGSDPTGTWRLWVRDHDLDGNAATINGWELELGYRTAEGDGADTISGGGGAIDLAVYTQRTQGITATLGGDADDGQAGEGDNLGNSAKDLENVYGSSSDDTMVGTDFAPGVSGRNELRGLAGADTISGLGDIDQIRGGNGMDNISAGGGNDTIHGQANADTIDGGDGFDRAFYGYSNVGMYIDLSVPEAGFARDEAPGDPEVGNDDDVVTFVENISGTSKADTILGNRFANVFWGTQGNDYLDGGTESGAFPDDNDTLDGAEGTDTCVNGENTPGCENLS